MFRILSYRHLARCRQGHAPLVCHAQRAHSVSRISARRPAMSQTPISRFFQLHTKHTPSRLQEGNDEGKRGSEPWSSEPGARDEVVKRQKLAKVTSDSNRETDSGQSQQGAKIIQPALGSAGAVDGDQDDAGAANTAQASSKSGDQREGEPSPQNAQRNLGEVAEKNMALAAMAVSSAGADGPDLGQLLTEASWQSVLEAEMRQPYWSKLQAFLRVEWKGAQDCYPPKQMVFRALNSCPLQSVRVVIVGQDPYHNPGEAMGWSFSVPRGQKIPSSLRNIYKEIQDDVGGQQPKHGCLEKWAMQGVLMLNAVLTVRKNAAASHAKKGWEPFTDAVLRAINKHQSNVVFLLWGRYAQDKGRVINRSKHLVLECAHPSGLSANRGFFGCRHFSQANRYLSSHNLSPIEWQII